VESVLRRKLESRRDWMVRVGGYVLVRYVLVSGATVVLSFSVIALLYGTRLIPDAVWATGVGNLVAALPAYQLNRRWAWRKSGRSHVRREILPFWVFSALGIVASIGGASIVRHTISSHHWSHLLNTGLVSMSNVASFAVLWVLKLALLNRLFGVESGGAGGRKK
jgi:putative flippase GtrA